MLSLSIIVPLFNSERFLPKCLDSLLRQDIPSDSYEIILVNDGSPDHSLELARRYARDNSNIVVLSQENKGTSGARNTGIRNATGKYLYFVDPDDYILENSLKELIRRMEDESLDILRFGYTEVNEDYKPTKSCKHPEQPDYTPCVMDGCSFMAKRLGTACYVWTYLFKASLIKKNSIYFIEGDYFDDTPWLPRVMAIANRVDSVDITRHFYVIRSNSLVQSKTSVAMKRKIDGQLFLIEELQRQNRLLTNANAQKWYRMMISSCILTLLTMIGKYEYSSRYLYLRRISSYDVFPLSQYRNHGLNWLKVLIINVSPELFCRVVHFRGR